MGRGVVLADASCMLRPPLVTQARLTVARCSETHGTLELVSLFVARGLNGCIYRARTACRSAGGVDLRVVGALFTLAELP